MNLEMQKLFDIEDQKNIYDISLSSKNSNDIWWWIWLWVWERANNNWSIVWYDNGFRNNTNWEGWEISRNNGWIKTIKETPQSNVLDTADSMNMTRNSNINDAWEFLLNCKNIILL